jgi:hypothetical protein
MWQEIGVIVLALCGAGVVVSMVGAVLESASADRPLPRHDEPDVDAWLDKKAERERHGGPSGR